MKDAQILDLYWERQEQAIYETQKAYGNYCYSIAWNILYSREDSDECVNDTWLRLSVVLLNAFTHSEKLPNVKAKRKPKKAERKRGW